MAAETTRCYSMLSCGAVINNSSPLSPQLWTSQKPSTAWHCCHHADSRSSWHSTSADQLPQEPLRQEYHNAVGHRMVIRAYQSDARTQARGPTIPGNIQPCYRSAPSFTSTGMWLHLQREDCSCHGLRGRSGSTRRLANRFTTSTRLDLYLPGDLWPTLEHE